MPDIEHNEELNQEIKKIMNEPIDVKIKLDIGKNNYDSYKDLIYERNKRIEELKLKYQYPNEDDQLWHTYLQSRKAAENLIRGVT